MEKQFRNAAFNVFFKNRDDHAKNFSFLMDREGRWSVSPAYDLIYSMGPGGEHCSSIMGNGKSPSQEDLLNLAKISQIDRGRALKIIDEVKAATLKWKSFAKQAGVSPRSQKLIWSAVSEL